MEGIKRRRLGSQAWQELFRRHAEKRRADWHILPARGGERAQLPSMEGSSERAGVAGGDRTDGERVRGKA